MHFRVRVFGERLARVIGNASAVALIAAAPCIANAGADADARARAERALRTALKSSATWRMERTLPGSDRRFISSGTVVCHVGGTGIEWRTIEPFQSLVAMRKDSMEFEDEDGKRTKSSSEMSRYDDIRKATDAFASGDADAFERIFVIQAEPLPGGKWKAQFLPRMSAMRELIKSIELTGGDLPERAMMTSGNGMTSTIRFAEMK